MSESFTDRDASVLLQLLHKYMEDFAPDLPVTIPALAEDLAMSQDVTTDRDDYYRNQIEALWNA